jgi:hypothetical protein
MPAKRVTADIRGDSSGGYVNTPAAIVKRILTGRCGISSGDIDNATFTALDSAAGYDCGIFISGEQSRQAVIDRLLASVGAWLAPSRTGVWQVGQLVAPSGTPVATFTDDEILSLERQATRDAEAGVPVYRVKVTYKPPCKPQFPHAIRVVHRVCPSDETILHEIRRLVNHIRQLCGHGICPACFTLRTCRDSKTTTDRMRRYGVL